MKTGHYGDSRVYNKHEDCENIIVFGRYGLTPPVQMLLELRGYSLEEVKWFEKAEELLKNLKHLNIAEIDYKTLPLTIRNLKKLEYLRYAGVYVARDRELTDEEDKMIKELDERGVEV